MTIVDTDTHITEPADLWTSRLPERWGDLRMHVEWDDTFKAEVWKIGDTTVTRAWAGCMFGFEGGFPSAPATLAEAHPATYDARERLKAMDESGVDVAVLYPNIAGLAFDPFCDLADPEIAAAHVSAYNDFQLEWVAAAPKRFVPMAVIPYWDVARAVAEVERTAALGFRGVVTTGAPHKHGQPYLGDRRWDPLWQACVDAGLPVSFHAANGDLSEYLAPERFLVDGPAVTVTRTSTSAFLDNAHQVTDLLCCGVLARFPDLKVVSVESGLGWIPFVLESADYHFKKSRVEREKPEFGDLLPSDLFHRQVFVNYWFERLEPWHVDAIGADNILFETDFPHPTCLHGDEVRAALNNGLEALPQDVQDKILWRNAARLYRLDVD
jgi:predicted TIM-barrel fold metal-dependent hydrolase